MISFQDVFVDAIWILGLAGLLATLSYIIWYKNIRKWTWGHTFGLPRALVPLCLSLECFCIGLALNGITSLQQAPWWETAAWSLLAVLFAIQVLIYGIAGVRRGWDTPMEGKN